MDIKTDGNTPCCRRWSILYKWNFCHFQNIVVFWGAVVEAVTVTFHSCSILWVKTRTISSPLRVGHLTNELKYYILGEWATPSRFNIVFGVSRWFWFNPGFTKHRPWQIRSTPVLYSSLKSIFDSGWCAAQSQKWRHHSFVFPNGYDVAQAKSIIKVKKPPGEKTAQLAIWQSVKFTIGWFQSTVNKSSRNQSVTRQDTKALI